MAEETTDLVADGFGEDEPCRTATDPLPGVENPTELDDFVSRYEVVSPTDPDVVACDCHPGLTFTNRTYPSQDLSRVRVTTS
jgi:hypothetical protein